MFILATERPRLLAVAGEMPACLGLRSRSLGKRLWMMDDSSPGVGPVTRTPLI